MWWCGVVDVRERVTDDVVAVSTTTAKLILMTVHEAD
jgi:hypothetical protein